MDNTFIGVLTGTDPDGTDVEIKLAVARRFEAIRGTLRMKSGDYVYGGNRCEPENLGWRMLQNSFSLKGRERPTASDIKAGKYDAEIAATWHEAASAEHWYMYEKDWGYGPGRGPFGD